MIRYLIALLLSGIASHLVNAQQVIILHPGPEGKDAIVNSANPLQNGGESFKFDAMGWTFYGLEGAKRSLIDFDLSSLPENIGIQGATLNLYFYTDEPTYVPHSGDNSAYLRLVTSAWEEDQVTWTTMPQVTLEGQVWLPPSIDPEQDYLDIDITGLVRQRYDEPDNTFGFMLQLANETPYRSLMFSSGDNTDSTLRPRLEITYCTLPATDFQFITNDLYVEFNDLSNSSNSWWWDFGDGYFSYMKNPTHVYPIYGTYTICLTTSDSCGSATRCKTLVISPSVVLENAATSMKIFPVPASDKVSLRLPSQGNFRISFLETSGTVLRQDDFYSTFGQEFSFDVSSFPAGFYTVLIRGAEGSYCGRFVIIR